MTSTTVCIYENAGNVSEVNADVFSTLENESDVNQLCGSLSSGNFRSFFEFLSYNIVLILFKIAFAQYDFVFKMVSMGSLINYI